MKSGGPMVLFRAFHPNVCVCAANVVKSYISKLNSKYFLPSYTISMCYSIGFFPAFLLPGSSHISLSCCSLSRAPIPHSKFAQIQNSMAMSNSTTYNCCIMPEVLCLCVCCVCLSFFLSSFVGAMAK